MESPVGRAVAHDPRPAEVRRARPGERREIVCVETVGLEHQRQELPELDGVLHILEARLDARLESLASKPRWMNVPETNVAAAPLRGLDHPGLDLRIRRPGLETSGDGARGDAVEKRRLLLVRSLTRQLVKKRVEPSGSREHFAAVRGALEKREKTRGLAFLLDHLSQYRVNGIRIGHQDQSSPVQHRLPSELRSDERASGVEGLRDRPLEKSSKRFHPGGREDGGSKLVVRDRFAKRGFCELQVAPFPLRLRAERRGN